MQERREQHGDQSAPLASEPATILVVDDDAPLRMLLDSYLTAFGYRILLASDGQKAIQIARDHPEIRLAILDVVMPGLCGQELANQLQADLPRAAMLFCSGHPLDVMSLHGIKVDSVQFMQKPCRPPELQKKIEELLSTR